MIKGTLRKNGGATILTIPSDVLKMMDLRAGSSVQFDVSKNKLTLIPVTKKTKRYTLEELLQGTSAKTMAELKKDTAWFLDASSVGREL